MLMVDSLTQWSSQTKTCREEGPSGFTTRSSVTTHVILKALASYPKVIQFISAFTIYHSGFDIGVGKLETEFTQNEWLRPTDSVYGVELSNPQFWTAAERPGQFYWMAGMGRELKKDQGDFFEKKDN